MAQGDPGRLDHEVPEAAGPQPTVPPPGDGAAAGERVVEVARGLLETGVGLGVLGLLRLRSERPRLEAELERRGLIPLAALSRSTGNLLDQAVLRLLQPPAPTARPRPGGAGAPGPHGPAEPGGSGEPAV